MAHILVVGAADTGRAPMAAELLRRLLRQQGMSAGVSSAGVLGHEGDEMQVQAKLALESLGCEPADHQARALTEALAAEADLLLAVDHSSARVILARHEQFAGKVAILPQLAGGRDVPDLFHMTLDTWVFYGRQIQDQLRVALPEILRRAGAASPAQSPAETPPAATQLPVAAAREQQVTKVRRVLTAVEEVPEIVDWGRAREVLSTTLASLAAQAQPGDMAPALAALLQGLLSQQTSHPTAGQTRWLLETAAMLAQPVDAAQLSAAAAGAATWTTR